MAMADECGVLIGLLCVADVCSTDNGRVEASERSSVGAGCPTISERRGTGTNIIVDRCLLGPLHTSRLVRPVSTAR